MKNAIRKLKHFFSHPGFRMGMGIAILIAGILEIIEVATEEFIGIDLKSHHILILFALNQIIIAFAHMMDGIEKIEVVSEEKKIEMEEKKIEERENKLF